MINEEKFPERPNATLPLHVETTPSKALVTLHDRSTGTPLDTCSTPCTLMRQSGGKYMVTAFKMGFYPQAINRSGTASEENTLKLPLNINVFKALSEYRKCRKIFDKSEKVDGEAKPCYRIPGPMPIDAKTSGHCNMQYDLDKFGKPQNVSANYCTNESFKMMSELAISWWLYYPKIERGIPVSQSGLETKITFRLQDEEGNLIPEPDTP